MWYAHPHTRLKAVRSGFERSPAEDCVAPLTSAQHCLKQCEAALAAQCSLGLPWLPRLRPPPLSPSRRNRPNDKSIEDWRANAPTSQ
eukprot:9988468-Alexandrium_andersonii.AAC.1